MNQPSILTLTRILLGAPSCTKEEAIRLAGQLLVNTGCVLPEYVEGMLAREKTMSTYVGYGFSIPHGEYENYAHILQSGLSFVQFPDGVEWDEGEKAYVVIGIAARANEHVKVLAQLAEAIEDENLRTILMTTQDPHKVLEILSVSLPVE